MTEPTPELATPEVTASDLADVYGVKTDKGLCLTLGFTYVPNPAQYTVFRLCDQNAVFKPEVVRLHTWEAPTCNKCRKVFLEMKKDGVR